MPENLERQKLLAEIELLKAKTVAYEYEATEVELRIGPKVSHPINHRVLNFWNTVSKGSVFSAVETLGVWFNESQTDDIHINFNSPGGSIFDGLALYDYVKEIQAAGVKVTTSCVGMAASMAGILLQVGDERTIGANSYLMIHEASSEAWGKTSEIFEQAALVRRIQDRCYGILAARSTMTAAQIRSKSLKKDWYLAADEAQALGFVDAIR